MALKAGTKADYANSMAQAMEKAFLDEWPHIMTDEQPKPEITDHMRLLFIAVAQGVVRHLVDNADSFKVLFSDGAFSANVDIEHSSTLY